MRYVYITLLLLLLVLPSMATTTTGVVLDPNGNAYGGGSFIIDFVNGTGCGLPLLSGSPFQTQFAGTLDSGGNLPSLSLADNNVVCSGSTWRFSICNSGRTACFSTTITITGASQSVSATLKAAATVLPGLTLPAKQAFTASTTANASGVIPAGTAPTSNNQVGDFWFDSTQNTLTFSEIASATAPVHTGGVICQSSNQASTVINTQTTITGTSCPMGAGEMNVVGKTIRVHGYGVYSITTGTPIVALNLNIGATTEVTCTSTATTNAVSNFPVEFEFFISDVTTGATGTDIGNCKLTILLGASATAAASVFTSATTAATAGFDHTVANTIVVQGLAAGASNAFRLFGPYTVELMN